VAKLANARLWGLPLRSDGNRYSAPPISAPTVAAVVNSASQITVTASGGASSLGSITGYRYRRNGIVVNQTPSASPLVDTGLFASTQYFYTATAVDSAGNESVPATVVSATTQSSADTTAPTAPAISATALSASTIRIALTVASTDSGGSGFRDYTLQSAIAAAGPFTDLVTAMAGAAFPYTHSGLPGSTTRYYRLRAFDNAGNNSTSAVVSATTDAAAGQWSPFTGPQFQFGVPSSWGFGNYAPAGSSNYIIGTSGQPNTPNSAKLAELAARGITLDVAGKRLVYDGLGTAGSVSALILEDTAAASNDWQSRISGPGVVWFHNFDSAAEVNAFRWTGGYAGGNDPGGTGDADAQYVEWVPTGGADGGGYMRLTRNSPSMDGNYWWRPFSPLTGASNGRGQDDPAANGTLTLGTYVATQGGAQGLNWGQSSNAKPGWYGHPADQNSFYDGHDFYVQVRVKVDPRRTTPGNISVGKFTSFTTTNDSYTAQELVTYGGYWEGAQALGMPNIHNVYQGYNYTPLAQVSTGTRNPVSPKWAYSFGWDTLLYHVTPGRHGVNETRYEVWAAHEGETSYTKIWDATYPAYYDSGANSVGSICRPGWNAMLCWIYHNGATMSTFWQAFDQIIFSRQFINCPQA
jgi:hypothetical protein